MQICNDMHQLKLIYDTSEANHKQSKEKAKLQSQFVTFKNIIAKTKRLLMGDFLWML